jgi:predicted nicotinamide N-methyase
VLATRANAERNDVGLEAIECAWADPEPILARAPWDLVLASDVLYERRNAGLLLELLGRLVDERGLVLVADPGRTAAADFVERAEADGWSVLTRGSPRSKAISIYRMRRG